MAEQYYLDVDVPEPNEALTALLLSVKMREIMSERAHMAQMLYQAQVAKRTRRLAKSADAHTEVGGKYHDRWIGELTIGGVGELGDVDYAASHEFGAGLVVDGHYAGYQRPAHDLEQVLAQLEGF